jgi:hypothetical protein
MNIFLIIFILVFPKKYHIQDEFIAHNKNKISAIPAKSFPAILQTAIFKHLKPRAMPWAAAPSVLRTEQKLCCYQPERLTVQQPRATPWDV